MLRKNKADVEKLRLEFRIDSNLGEEVRNIRAESFGTEDQAKGLADLDEAATSYANGLEISDERKRDIQSDTRILLERQQETLKRLNDLQQNSFNALFGLLSEQRQFAKLCDEYTSYIDQRVLWIRSAKVIEPADFATIMTASRQLASPAIWRSVGQSLLASMRNRLSMLLIIGSGLCLLFAFQGRLRRNISETAKQTSRRTCREFTPSAAALLETILIASLWPTVVLTAGWLLRADILGAAFTHALGGGLIAVGLAAAPFEFLRQVCRKDGLAEAHFDWPALTRRTVHANIRWLLVFGAPLLLVTVTLDHFGNEEWNNSLGRVCAIALLLLSAVFIYQVLRPGGPLFLNHQNRESNFYRLRYLRFAVFVIGHIALIAFAIAGYYYTAYQLGTNLLQSIAVAIGLLTLYAISLRFLLVRRRRLRYEQLVQQREQQKKHQQTESELDVSAVTAKLAESMDIEIKSEVGTDIISVSRQARELTGVIFVVASLIFVWQIWQDVVPATKLLDKFELWPVAVGDKGETDVVSLGDLLISLGLFLLTFFSVRNIPGMLELLLLKRLPLDSGSRYAITTIFRYIITVVGVILALNYLKIPWSKYRWLVAAVSVCLGFGFQEIVAKLV
jgi:potassium efflux system protein